jgi:hypothetical protein
MNANETLNYPDADAPPLHGRGMRRRDSTTHETTPPKNIHTIGVLCSFAPSR